MPLEPYCAFVMMSFVLILIPGPNVVLIVANSIAHGRRYGLVTVAGTSAAMAAWFEWLRWIGVAYLV